MSWSIKFYETEDGHNYVKEFLDNIEDSKLKAKVLHDIGLLQQFGTKLPKPHADYLEDGIWELRTKQGSNIARTLYFTVSGKTIILLNGFVKKTQKTPPGVIKKAKDNRDDYVRRHS